MFGVPYGLGPRYPSDYDRERRPRLDESDGESSPRPRSRPRPRPRYPGEWSRPKIILMCLLGLVILVGCSNAYSALAVDIVENDTRDLRAYCRRPGFGNTGRVLINPGKKERVDAGGPCSVFDKDGRYVACLDPPGFSFGTDRHLVSHGDWTQPHCKYSDMTLRPLKR
jgi:hypothetical protein